MKRRLRLSLGIAATLAAAVTMIPAASPAQAQDFFASFFRSFGSQRTPAVRTPFASMSYSDEPQVQFPPRASAPGLSVGGGGTAYCVRTCDGRHFPVPAAANQSRADTCKSFCPAAETRVYYGSSIDEASTENGKDYSDLPNAFRYRTELVQGCTCNGTDPLGLAKVDIKDDKTLRRGDFVAAADGLKIVNGRPDRRGAELNFSPAPRAVRSRFERNAVLD